MTREICKACGRINSIGFNVPDDIWAKVVPKDYRDSVVCLACFTEWADDALCQWDTVIEFYPVSTHTQLAER